MKYLNFLIFTLLVLLFSCKDEELTPDIPIVLTGSIENISEQGTVFNGKILSLGQDAVDDIGFVWDTLSNPTINKSFSKIAKEQGVGTFSHLVDFDLIKSKKYFVRAFINFGNEIYYGNETSFVSKGSLGPTIKSFSPNTGNRGDTLVITGENFSNRLSNNKVILGNYECLVINSSKNELMVVLPNNIFESGEISLSVEIYGVGKDTFEGRFLLGGPLVTSISPISSYCKRIEMTIKGSGFSPINYKNAVFFYEKNSNSDDKYIAEIIESSETDLIIRTPYLYNLGSYRIEINSDGIKYNVPYSYAITKSEILNVTPLSGPVGTEIEITASFINSTSTIYLGDERFISGVSNIPNTAIVELPYDFAVGEYPIKVSTICEEIVYENNFTVISPWKYHSTFPGKTNSHTYSFVIGNSFYILQGSDYCDGDKYYNELWAYDTETSDWQRKADFPGVPRSFGTITTQNSKAYFGTGINSKTGKYYGDFWEYDSQTNAWRQFPDLPFTPRKDCIAFSYNGTIYMGGGRNGTRYYDLFEFNTKTEQWTKNGWFPEYTGYIYKYSGKIFLISKTRYPLVIHEFSESGKKFLPNNTGIYKVIQYAIQGEYETYLLGSENNILQINPVTKEVTEYSGFLNVIERKNYIGAYMNNKIYVGLGENEIDNCFNDFLYLDISE